MRINNILSNYFPFLGVPKRIVHAFLDMILPIKSYSQHGEDTFIYNYLSNINQLNGTYIDVGANHPSSISNTYYFYRNGFSGITIEPNRELARLLRFFRQKDKVFQIGIDKKPGLFELYINKAPVLSSLKKIDNKELWKSYSVPVLRLDDVSKFTHFEKVFLLNIDTEGLNYNVIQGCDKTLEKTVLVCIEVDNKDDEMLITKFMTQKHNFRKVKKLGCNIIFVNKAFDADY